MNTHLKKIITLSKEIKNLIHSILRESVRLYKEQSRKKQIGIAVVAVLVCGVLLKLIFGNGTEVKAVTSVDRKVTLASVASLSNMEKDFPLIGTVTSVSEATIRSESGGKLVRVYKKLGDSIYAGGVIAEFENSGERASLLQAEGAYEQAKASRSIASLNSGQAGSSLGDTKTQALNAISSAYSTMDDAVRGKTDTAYSDPKFDQIRLLLSVPDVTLTSSLETKRKNIERLLREREAKNKNLKETDDLVSELTALQNEVQTIKSYLDDLFTAYSKALPDSTFTQVTLDSGKSNTQSARQAISGTLSALSGARTAITASITANEVAGGGVTQGSGALASADAQVKQALGAYNAALSRVEKTVIRSPITGTLNSLSINTGDYIGAFTQVAVVSNNGALEVVSFVTEDDAKRITINSPVLINGTIEGVVTRIASALDPVTKKIEVRIGIKNAKTALINGQSVSIVITKNKKQSSPSVASGPIVIPLSALKLTPRGANVFVLSASSTLVSLPVKEGAILGEQIQILEGLTGAEDIVVDARGLKEGAQVSVATQ